MHPNPLYRAATPAENLALVRQRGFGVLTVNGPDAPIATHVPFVVSADGAAIELHLSRANPLVAHLTAPRPALLVVSGPDAYVSPDWYGLDAQVPTWNYAAVHVRGELALRPDEDLPGHLEQLAAAHERGLAPKIPWTPASMPGDRLASMTRAIVGARLTVDAIDGTWKLGQNKPVEARHAAADAVGEAGYGSEATALADLMRRSEPS